GRGNLLQNLEKKGRKRTGKFYRKIQEGRELSTSRPLESFPLLSGHTNLPETVFPISSQEEPHVVGFLAGCRYKIDQEEQSSERFALTSQGIACLSPPPPSIGSVLHSFYPTRFGGIQQYQKLLASSLYSLLPMGLEEMLLMLSTLPTPPGSGSPPKMCFLRTVTPTCKAPCDCDVSLKLCRLFAAIALSLTSGSGSHYSG
ncbi:hypothetical protein STEG23_027397, partial [Scotinomys teguina]